MFEKFRLSSTYKEVVINLNEIIAIEDNGLSTTKIITSGVTTIDNNSIINTTYIVDCSFCDICSLLRQRKLLK